MILKSLVVTAAVLSGMAAAEDEKIVVRPSDFVERAGDSKEVFAGIFADQITLAAEDGEEDETEVPDGKLFQSPASRKTYYVTDRGTHRAQVSSDTKALPAAPNGEVRELEDPDGTKMRTLWQSKGRGTWVSLVDRDAYEQLKPQPPPPAPPVIRSKDPLILDLDGDKIRLVGPSKLIRFDVDADGVPEFTGWPAGKDDAFLVLDRNGNGIIDNGSELFGMTSRNPGQENGFVVLKQLDSNNDEIIDKRDTEWSKLRLWIDSNMDGRTQPDNELLKLETRGVIQIDLAYKTDKQSRDSHYNLFREYSEFSREVDGEVVTRPIVNIWFQSNVVP
jgi:hypothetical protein